MLVGCITVVAEHVLSNIAAPLTATHTYTDRDTDRQASRQTPADTDGNMQCRLMHSKVTARHPGST